MKTITAITAQVKNAKRCNIFLDGEFFCGLPLETVVKNRLKAGMAVDERQLEKLQLEAERASAVETAMNFLSGAVKTEKQTRDHLREKGYTPLVTEHVIEKLTEYGLLDDWYYAERYVETYAGRKGALLMRQELKRRGLSDSVASGALEELGDQFEAALLIAEKYMKGREAELKTVQKLYRQLLSKGFTYDEAKYALDKIRQGDDL